LQNVQKGKNGFGTLTTQSHPNLQIFRLILEVMEHGFGCNEDGRKSTAFQTLKPTWVVIFLQIRFFSTSSIELGFIFER